jgi:hypothetical protein
MDAVQSVLPSVDRRPLYADVVLLLFGYGTKRQHLGAGQTRTCSNCHNTTQWARLREFEQFTLFFVPVARWKRRQLEASGICGTAVAV